MDFTVQVISIVHELPILYCSLTYSYIFVQFHYSLSNNSKAVYTANCCFCNIVHAGLCCISFSLAVRFPGEVVFL